MSALVTIAEAKLYCRVDQDGEDSLFAILIEGASAAALDVAESWSPVGGGPVPDRIKLAVLVHVGNAYDNRDAADMPASAARLLGPLRLLDV